jgi:NADPH:quinone reductase-like Zn-dependent oxidoreductase
MFVCVIIIIFGSLPSVAVGSGCTRLKVGDQVWADSGGGTGAMAQYVIVFC